MRISELLLTLVHSLQPGRNNPVVDLWMVDISALVSGGKDTVIRLPPPAKLATIDHYFSAVGFGSEDTVSVIWMNRHQVLVVAASMVSYEKQ